MRDFAVSLWFFDQFLNYHTCMVYYVNSEYLVSDFSILFEFSDITYSQTIQEIHKNQHNQKEKYKHKQVCQKVVKGELKSEFIFFFMTNFSNAP